MLEAAEEEAHAAEAEAFPAAGGAAPALVEGRAEEEELAAEVEETAEEEELAVEVEEETADEEGGAGRGVVAGEEAVEAAGTARRLTIARQRGSY